jgi:hypothetical protein
VLDSTKILVATDVPAWSSGVRSGEAPTIQNLYLESLIKVLVCGLDYLIIRKNCEASVSKLTPVSASM